ncbi:hypothetical protein [Oceanibacterium hippocampi]|uniref:Uncharacterized protein n=1 Tax=Oceanibacterium hippocampi TaxID=745714 RepID=A0A1Y5TZC7_9PROT|nr:hypothetical protein [Oceanibacterium hippocampi]SLN77289.1 hypothetical protein OCH7691_04374 [Oceanibacterium hippocampi]
MVTIPTTMPSRLVAGDRWQWRREDLVSDYPAGAGWALAYVLRPPEDGVPVEIDASADGDAFAIDVPSATTEGYTPGTYRWSAHVTLGGERTSVDTGSVRIDPDLANAAHSTVSHAAAALAAIQTAIENAAADNQQAITMPDGTRIERLDMAQLLMMRDRYRREVARENAATSVRPPRGRLIKTRFR